MLFGLMNAPSTVQRMMDKLVIRMPFIKVYFEEVVVFSETMADYVVQVHQAIQLLCKNRLRLRLENCNFAQSKIPVLGHIVDASEVGVDEEK